jgi:Type II secretion system (T2SS), protein K
VLIAALMFVALLALVGVVVESWVSASLDRAFRLGERVAARSAMISAVNRIAFVATSGGFSARGLELNRPETDPEGVAAPQGLTPATPFVSLSQRAYRIGSTIIRLQDEAGLYDLSNPLRGTLEKLLKGYGISGPQRQRLANALADYMRSEEARGGDALATQYREAGLAPPRHAALLTPWELYRVRGWRDAKSLWQEPSALADLATTGPIGGLNVNTASAKILAAMTAMDERAASRIAASRAASPITDLLDLRALGEGAGGEDQPLVLLPGNMIRLKLSEPGEPLMYVVTIRLTPLGKTPYRVEYAVRLPLDAVARALTAADLPNFPSGGGAP